MEDDGEKKGEEKRDGCEEKGVEMDEEKDSTPPVDMMADTTHPDTQDDDELPTVGDTQLGLSCIVGLEKNCSLVPQVLMTPTSRVETRLTRVHCLTALLICLIGMNHTR